MTDRELLELILVKLETIEKQNNEMFFNYEKQKIKAKEINKRMKENLEKQMQNLPPQFRGLLEPMIQKDEGEE